MSHLENMWREKSAKKVVIVISTLLHYFFMHCPRILFLILRSNVFNYLFLSMYEWMNELINEFYKIINDRMHVIPLIQETHDVLTKYHLFPSTCIGYGELRVMWGGGGAIWASTFTWLALFTREYSTILEIERSSIR